MGGWAIIHVIGLDLSQEFISGGLDNSSLFNLHYLMNLNLAYNDFHSMIPSKFSLLKNLRYLNLSNAGFEGQIPIEITHLTKLFTLDLSTSFTSIHTLKLEKPNIGMLMQNLTEITELYLDGVRVSTSGKEWCYAISSLKKLHVFSMSSCNLSGPIDSSLSKLQSLSVIQLNLNNMSSPVPESFANLSSLTTLQLSSCELTGVFPKDIFQIQKLKVLDISDNHDLGGSLPYFPQDGYLQTLNLSNTNFSGHLPRAISNLKLLSTLDLSYCQFGGTLPISFSGLSQLVHLDLSFNNFTGPLPSLNMSKDLNYLSLIHNNFTGPIPSSYLKGLVNLVVLNLGFNSLNGRVPSSLFALPSLQELTLSHNGFDGFLDEILNASSSTLQLVDLTGNKLQGTIPVCLFHMKNLDFLQLSSNQFNGTIRLDMFWRLPNLHTLGLSHNNLSVDTTFNDDPSISLYPSKKRLLLASCKLREFPAFLRNQSQLISLDLSSNQIQGTIPNWIWRFDSMVDLNISNNFLTDLEGPFENLVSNIILLDLHSNQLGGSIPTFPKYAAMLDYSSNRFSFFPPHTKKYLHFAYFLSLSNNSFHGKIDESFCDCSTLRMLDLSHNMFNGFIPECLTRSSTLRVLNLAGNKLSGYLSDSFPSSCDLRFLDLNGNLMGGTIPKSLVNCHRLEVVNLGNNLLSDRFPCFFKNISTLRVLILRSNKLHGSIGCKHGTGNWEMLHIIDLASNNFTGTLPGTLLQSWTAMMGGVKDKASEKPGNLFFDMYDFHDFVSYKDVLSVLNKVTIMKIAKMEAGEPLSVLEHMFSYIGIADQLRGTYLDSVIVVNKGMQMMLAKILAVLTSLDLSSNHFDGPIPEELMSFKALIVLNLSHNAFSSHIPLSFGNLTQLESLDMSNNNLSKVIPTQMASLSFLSVLNLSFNHLVGKIPTGTQIQSFEADSFEGNEGLCGPPLTKNCSDDGVQDLPIPPYTAPETHSSIDWNFLSSEIGFTFGFGFVNLPLIFWKRWRLWYSKHVDDLLYKIFPQLDFVYEQHGGKNYRTLRWRPR
ncbi:receptor-like protein 7 [Gastrolobium bilobum]|uniref:receptor-like protein 7 n=1 Tax=Gastrolobium bilobum TaxID=150636 RepID=UPI002AB071A5|nr:receptor-like protein 7 [Gastrolobium bilobum]